VKSRFYYIGIKQEGMAIKDYICGKEVIISDSTIKYDDSEIHFNEVSDFTFEQIYYNGIGGITFFLLGGDKHGGIINMRIQTESNRDIRRSKDDIEKIEKVFKKVAPLIIDFYAKHMVDMIRKKGQIKIWKITFLRDRLMFKPRKSFWTKTVEIPYGHVELDCRYSGVGLFGHTGKSHFFGIIDTRSKQRIKYSTNASFQPLQGDIFKLEAVIDLLNKEHQKPMAVSTQKGSNGIKYDKL
jgi:hypothetical protein